MPSWTLLAYAYTFAMLFWWTLTPPWLLISEGYTLRLWAIFFLIGAGGTVLPFALYTFGLSWMAWIQAHSDDFAARVQELTGGRGADVIYDPVGGDVFDGSTKCIAFEGRLLPVGFTGGRIAEVATNRVLLKNFSVVGVHWGLYQRRGSPLIDRWMEALFALYEQRQLRPVIYRTYPLRDAAAGLRALAERESHGKVVLIP